MHEEIRRLLADQHECLAHWQLLDAGFTEREARWRLTRNGLRRFEDGVWTSVQGELTPLQRRSAATLTAPMTALGTVDALAHWNVREHRADFVVVVRPGTGGPRRHGGVLVTRTRHPVSMMRHRVPVVPPARALVDSACRLDDRELRRAVIEALRLRSVPCELEDLRAELDRRPRRPGALRLRPFVEAVAGLPLGRTKSNAEGEALLRRKEAGRPPVEVNVKVGGFEADLVDHDRKEIVEIDGPAFHADPVEDAQRDAAWRGAGYQVRRRPSDDAYNPGAAW